MAYAILLNAGEVTKKLDESSTGDREVAILECGGPRRSGCRLEAVIVSLRSHPKRRGSPHSKLAMSEGSVIVSLLARW